MWLRSKIFLAQSKVSRASVSLVVLLLVLERQMDELGLHMLLPVVARKVPLCAPSAEEVGRGGTSSH